MMCMKRANTRRVRREQVLERRARGPKFGRERGRWRGVVETGPSTTHNDRAELRHQPVRTRLLAHRRVVLGPWKLRSVARRTPRAHHLRSPFRHGRQSPIGTIRRKPSGSAIGPKPHLTTPHFPVRAARMLGAPANGGLARDPAAGRSIRVLPHASRAKPLSM